MKRILAMTALAALMTTAAYAQPYQNAPVGQTNGGINTNAFANNTDPAGFNETSQTAAVVATGTTQATSKLLTTRLNVITTCPSYAGVVLPSVQRYAPITVINRTGAACLVYPSPGASLETALGTTGAVNAAAGVNNNTDTVFRPVLLANGTIVWYQ